MAIHDPTTPDEVWYPVPDLPDYQISSDLRVRRLSRKKISRRKLLSGNVKWLYLEVHLVGNPRRPYPVFRTRIDGKSRCFYLHHVLAKLAYGPVPGGMQVNHWDDDPLNPYPSNLYYGTQSSNMRDAKRNGRIKIRFGEECHSSKLTDAQVEEIRTGKESLDDLVRRFGMNKSYLCGLRTGRIRRGDPTKSV